jgi:hypothetical protein
MNLALHQAANSFAQEKKMQALVATLTSENASLKS